MKIVAESHIPYVKEYFAHYGELILKPGRSISAEDVIDADMLLVRSITPVTEALLAKSQVKFVGSITAGADHMATHWLDEHGIKWRTAQGFNAPPVADYVVSVIAALERTQQLTSQKKRAAVIGVGNAGNLVSKRLRVLNCDVMLCDPLRAEQESDFNSTQLNELSDLDIISLHVPLTKQGAHPTYHFIDAEFMSRQKPGCVLINTSRGAVIDSESLLTHAKHLKWCFDVWEHEPRINKEILEHALIATPHIAGYSVQSKIRGVEMIYRAACELSFIEPQPIAPIRMPHQRLNFANENPHWQDIILGIFNPMTLSLMMKARLLAINDDGHLFDEMRNQFNYRHEFSFTNISNKTTPTDQAILDQLGVHVVA